MVDIDDDASGGRTWTTWTTERERVKAVAVSDQSPRSARGIAEEALVGAERTREILSELVDEGAVCEVERNDVVRYGPDREHIRREGVRMLHEADRANWRIVVTTSWSAYTSARNPRTSCC